MIEIGKYYNIKTIKLLDTKSYWYSSDFIRNLEEDVSLVMVISISNESAIVRFGNQLTVVSLNDLIEIG